MNEKTIRSLIKMVEESQIDSLEIRRFFRTIRITKNRGSDNHHPAPTDAASLVRLPASPATPSATPVAAEAKPASHYLEIKSPMVGTFYRASSPTTPSFVEPGRIIKPGDVLCIIEAMKLMNEIEAEHSGRIVKILVENAQPVEFGQSLFLLDPTVT